MGLSSLQVCVDSSDWFQGTIQEEAGMDSSSSPSGITDSMLACSRPLMERRLRPPHDQALKCPRCDSAHTKFCYYNNYSLTQPRYFCKTCRRYWTKGGTLRNIPVGGGCRKNKKVSSNSKKPTTSTTTTAHHHNPHSINPNPLIMNSSTDLQLSYNPESSMGFTGFGMGMGMGMSTNTPNFLFENVNGNASTRAIDFMENSSHFMGMMGGGYAADMGLAPNYHGGNLCSPFGGMTLDGINNSGGIDGFMDRGMIAYDDNDNMVNSLDVKPKILALEWQDQTGCSSGHGGKNDQSFGYLGTSWGGLINGYGPSTTS